MAKIKDNIVARQRMHSQKSNRNQQLEIQKSRLDYTKRGQVNKRLGIVPVGNRSPLYRTIDEDEVRTGANEGSELTLAV